MSKNQIQYDLIITIVKRGLAEDVVEAAKKAGAAGGTILHGRGTGIHEKVKIMGIAIHPEKEIVLILINTDITDKVSKAIAEAVEIDKPGHGVSFVIGVKKTAGISHNSDFMGTSK